MDHVEAKERACVDFIRDLWLSHQEEASDAPIPLFIGLNGVQGAGKTMLVGYVLFQKRLRCSRSGDQSRSSFPYLTFSGLSFAQS